jgi:hypothetical protein
MRIFASSITNRWNNQSEIILDKAVLNLRPRGWKSQLGKLLTTNMLMIGNNGCVIFLARRADFSTERFAIYFNTQKTGNCINECEFL